MPRRAAQRADVRPSASILPSAQAFKRRANFFFIRGECYSREQRGERGGAARAAWWAGDNGGVRQWNSQFPSIPSLHPSPPLPPADTGMSHVGFKSRPYPYEAISRTRRKRREGMGKLPPPPLHPFPRQRHVCKDDRASSS